MKRYLPLLVLLMVFIPGVIHAQGIPTISLGIGQADNPDQVSTALQIVLLLTVISVAPAILLMTTGFVRIVIVLSFVRQAMGTQQMPPNQVVVGLALFLTIFVMSPVFQKMNDQALQPYLDKKISQEQAITQAIQPMREFMFTQTSEKELGMLIEISGGEMPKNQDDVSTMALIPAFMLSELKRAFQIGFMIFIPFLVIDMLVASILMAMGMMMLPPVIISLPFKLLLFVLVDGWPLIVGNLVKSFH